MATATGDILHGKWHEMKGKAKQKWGKLTDDDLNVISGKQEELSGAIQKRYGYDKARADMEVRNWLNEQKV
jgi:uncharacterized protein YjbJ (UPF0337 family)